LRQRILSQGALACAVILCAAPAVALDLVVTAQDGKFVRVEGRATFPQPAPSDSLAVIDVEKKPPAIVATVGGLEHTVQGPPQAVAITADGKLALVGAPTRYDYDTKKEIFDNFVQIVDLEANPPKLTDKLDLGAHPNGITINLEGTLALAAMLDGTVKVLSISGKTVKLADTVKVGEKRLSGIAFTHDGKAAIVALRDEQGVATLSVEGGTVKFTGEKISTGVTPYAVDVASDGKWAIVGNSGVQGIPNVGKTAADVDSVTLVDVSKRPFRAVQYLTVPSNPEGVAISPDGKWIAVQSMDGSNLTPDNPYRRKLGKVVLFAIGKDGARKVNEVAGGEAAQGIVFSKDSKTVLVQFDVERAIAIYAIRDGKLVDSKQRLKLEAGPVSIRSMPR
jgi:DNA-binding beta-propeller fold protein YncE